MLIGVELIKYKNILSTQKEKISNYLQNLDREDDENFYDHLYLIDDFYSDAITYLGMLDEELFLRSPFYDDLSKISRIVNKLETLTNNFFSQKQIKNISKVKEGQESPALIAIESYISSLVNNLASLHNESTIVDRLDISTEENEKLNSTLKNLMDRLETLTINKINESLSINDKNLEEISDKSSKEATEYLEKLYDNTNKKTSDILAKLQQEISDLQASTKQNIVEQIDQIKTDLVNSKTELVGLVGDLEAYKSIVNHETEKEISKHYAEKATSEKRTYWGATILSIVIIVVSICLAWSGLDGYYKTYVAETNLEKLKALKQTAEYAKIYLGFRLVLSFLLFSTVIYTSRIAYRAYIHWRHSESMKLKLSSLRPFINQLEPDDRKQIHKDLVPDYFGKDAGMIDVAGEKFKDFPTNVSAVVMKAMDHANGALGNSKKDEPAKDDKNSAEKDKKEEA